MRVLITGANGMVGLALTRACLQRGWAVRAAVRSAEAVATLDAVGAGSGALEPVVVGDIHGHTDWFAALFGVDVVIHLAARVHQVNDQASDPVAAYRRVNTDGSVKLAESARKIGVSRFVFASSVKVLGEATAPGQPFDEHSVANPLDAYGQSKWAAEQALMAMSSPDGMGVAVLRPPLVYGPGVKANFAALWRAVARRWPLPAVVGNRRSLVGVDNVVDALLTLATHPAAAGHAYLVSDDDDVSTADLVRAMALAQGVEPNLWPVPLAVLRGVARCLGRGAAVDRLCGNLQVDITAIKRDLGWKPLHNLGQGMARLAQTPIAS